MKGTWYLDLIKFNGKIRTTDLDGVCEIYLENTALAVDCFFSKGTSFCVRVGCLCLCLVSLCCAQLCPGCSEYITSFQEQLGSLFSIPILMRTASGICVLVWVSGVPRNAASTAVLGMMLPFWLGVHLCPSPVPAVLHCFVPMFKAPLSHFLPYTLVFCPLY